MMFLSKNMNNEDTGCERTSYIIQTYTRTGNMNLENDTGRVECTVVNVLLRLPFFIDLDLCLPRSHIKASSDTCTLRIRTER